MNMSVTVLFVLSMPTIIEIKVIDSSLPGLFLTADHIRIKHEEMFSMEEYNEA